MSTFTIQNDLAVRGHLSTLAKAIRSKFTSTAYQGDYLDTTTGETFGDRLQVGTIATVEGVRYLLALNVLVSRNSGGRVSVRVSAWRMSDTGLMGTWVIRRTELSRVRLTPNGFVERIGKFDIPVGMAQRVATYLEMARTSLRNGHIGGPVVTVHTDRDGDNAYDTTESHLLPFGGLAKAMARLA